MIMCLMRKAPKVLASDTTSVVEGGGTGNVRHVIAHFPDIIIDILKIFFKTYANLCWLTDEVAIIVSKFTTLNKLAFDLHSICQPEIGIAT